MLPKPKALGEGELVEAQAKGKGKAKKVDTVIQGVKSLSRQMKKLGAMKIGDPMPKMKAVDLS